MDDGSNRKTERSDESIWNNINFFKIGLTVFLTFTACILLFFVLLRYKGIMSGIGVFLKAGESIIIGLMIAYLLNPVMKFVERYAHKLLKGRVKSPEKEKKMSRVIGVIGATVFLLIIIALLIAAIVPAVVSSIRSLVDTLPGYVESFISQLKKGQFGDTEFTRYFSLLLTNVTEYVEEWATTKLLPEAQNYITQITSGVISVVKAMINFVVGIVVAIYVMSIQETLIGQCKKIIYAIFSPSRGNLIIEVVRKSHKVVGGFISGKILDSAIIGVICYIGCCILRIPNSILVSVIVGATNIIPFFGPFIGAIPCLLLVVVQSPIHALYLLIFILVLQQVDGNIIGPKILGDSTGLSSFWVMFAILTFGGIFGFAGMVLGVPSMGVIYYLVRRLVNYGVQKRGLSTNTDDYLRLYKVDENTNEMIFVSEKKNEQKVVSGEEGKDRDDSTDSQV